MQETFTELENYLDKLNATLDQEEEQLHKYLVKNHFVQSARYPKNGSGQSLRPYYNNQIKAFIKHVLLYGFRGSKFEEGDELLIRWNSSHYCPMIIKKHNGTGAESDLKQFDSNIEMLSYIEGYNHASQDVGKLCWCRNS